MFKHHLCNLPVRSVCVFVSQLYLLLLCFRTHSPNSSPRPIWHEDISTAICLLTELPPPLPFVTARSCLILSFDFTYRFIFEFFWAFSWTRKIQVKCPTIENETWTGRNSVQFILSILFRSDETLKQETTGNFVKITPISSSGFDFAMFGKIFSNNIRT